MLLKICGVRGDNAASDIEMLADAGVDLVGLWHGVPGGHADLPRADFERLAVAANVAGVEPVLVTLENDAAILSDIARSSGIRWVQLHAYHLPSMVRRLVTALRPSGVRIIKVLHVQGRRCPDRRLVRSYESAGVDAFLLDTASQDGRVGDTGRSIPPDVAANLAAGLGRPFLLAGGIAARSRSRYARLIRHKGFLGVDVSTSARDRKGRLRMENVDAIRRSWSSRVGVAQGNVALR